MGFLFGISAPRKPLVLGRRRRVMGTMVGMWLAYYTTLVRATWQSFARRWR